jgi:hypothetical protein
MADKIPYLFERGDALFFRRRIPPRLQALAGLAEWKLTLGRAGLARSSALMEVSVLTEATDRAVAALERGVRPSPTLLQDALDALYPARAVKMSPTVWIGFQI